MVTLDDFMKAKDVMDKANIPKEGRIIWIGQGTLDRMGMSLDELKLWCASEGIKIVAREDEE